MDKKLFEVLACPHCHSKLKHEKYTVSTNENNDKPNEELICRHCALAYPVRDNIPVMLEGEARTLTTDERLAKT